MSCDDLAAAFDPMASPSVSSYAGCASSCGSDTKEMLASIAGCPYTVPGEVSACDLAFSEAWQYGPPPAACADLDGDSTGMYYYGDVSGYGCNYYDFYPSTCGNTFWDDDDFTSEEMCCACGGVVAVT